MKKSILILVCILSISCSKDLIEENTSSIQIESSTNTSQTTFTTITINGKIISNNDTQITSKGICWSKNPNPTINDFKKTESENTFTTTIADLTVNTKYYFRVFAINKYGINYGENTSLNTLSLENTNWKLSTYYPQSQFSTGTTIDSTVDFFSNFTTKFDEIGAGQGLFITYGTWSLSGNTLTYIWEGSNANTSTYIYTGTLSGMTMSGTFTHPNRPGTWVATKN